MQQLSSVLLIDDDEISNFLTATVIKNIEVTRKIDIFQDGTSAINLLRRQMEDLGTYPDLILLDLNMPNMNGFDFLKAYREILGNKAGSVIIVLTTSNNLEDFEHLKNFPEVEVYLNKPLTEDSMRYILDKYFNPEFEPIF